MSKFAVVNLIDKLFVSISIFLIVYAWINFYIRDLWTTFILSLIFSFAIIYVMFYLFNKSKQKKALSKKNLEEINENFFAFKMLPKQNKLSLLKKILEKEFETNFKNGILTYTKENKKHLILTCTHIEILTQDELINLLDNHMKNGIDIIDIICNQIDKNLNTNIFKSKQINVINKQKLYEDFFKKFDIYPDKSDINFKATKLKFKDILKNLFIPKKAKSYFFCGLILLFSSLIIPFHTYYIIMGTILMIFSILCKLLPQFRS